MASGPGIYPDWMPCGQAAFVTLNYPAEDAITIVDTPLAGTDYDIFSDSQNYDVITDNIEPSQ